MSKIDEALLDEPELPAATLVEADYVRPAVRVGKAAKALEQLGHESHALDLFEILGEDMSPSVEETRRWEGKTAEGEGNRK